MKFQNSRINKLRRTGGGAKRKSVHHSNKQGTFTKIFGDFLKTITDGEATMIAPASCKKRMDCCVEMARYMSDVSVFNEGHRKGEYIILDEDKNLIEAKSEKKGKKFLKNYDATKVGCAEVGPF